MQPPMLPLMNGKDKDVICGKAVVFAFPVGRKGSQKVGCLFPSSIGKLQPLSSRKRKSWAITRSSAIVLFWSGKSITNFVMVSAASLKGVVRMTTKLEIGSDDEENSVGYVGRAHLLLTRGNQDP